MLMVWRRLFFKLENKSGSVLDNRFEIKNIPVIIDQKIIRFWENVDKLEV